MSKESKKNHKDDKVPVDVDDSDIDTTTKANRKKPSAKSSSRKKDRINRVDSTNNDKNETEEEVDLRRLEKHVRRAEKRAQRLAELGLDEHGNPLDNYCIEKYPVREMKFRLPGSQEPIAINPFVVLLAVLCLWITAIACVVDPTRSYDFLAAQSAKVALYFTWFFQGTKAIFFFFIFYLAYRYGHLQMGRKSDRPEFSNIAYFCMNFAAGVGPSALFYSVSEPMYHRSDNFFAKGGYRSQDEIDLFAINMTVTNWFMFNWVYVVVIGICLALAGHRFKLPMMYRTCFYPIFGDYTWGWIGDVIDGMTIVATVLGVCIILAMSSVQICNGSIALGLIDTDVAPSQVVSIQKIIIWVVTFLSTASVISGLQGAVPIVSLTAVGLGTLLMFLVLVMDDTKFLMNLQVQEVGYFLQTGLFELNFWTDAFGQLQSGSGRATDGKAAEQWWMQAWIVYYATWQACIAASIGMFLAFISKGRKLWEVVAYGYVAPCFYSLIWFCIWGGAGIRQARQGNELAVLGETFFNNSAYFLVDGSELCYNVPQADVKVGDETIFTNLLPGVTPVCEFDPDKATLNVLNAFSFPQSFGGPGLGPFLKVLYMIALGLCYVACSDSATLMVDSLASNGRKNYHWARRMFWAGSIGALTTSLLSLNGETSLGAMQSASYVLGLPVAVLLTYLLQSTCAMCEQAKMQYFDSDYAFPAQGEFTFPLYGGIFNTMEYLVSLGKVDKARIERGMHKATLTHVKEFGRGLMIPFVQLKEVLTTTYPNRPMTNMLVVASYSLCYYAWIGLFVASRHCAGLNGVMVTLFVVTGCQLAMIRSGFRGVYNLRSNSVADIVASTMLWPQVLAQMRVQVAVECEMMNENK